MWLHARADRGEPAARGARRRARAAAATAARATPRCRPRRIRPRRRRGRGKPGSGRRPGGQPGHEGKSRPLLPLERVDEVVEHWPERCRLRAPSSARASAIDAARRQRHQVSELPPIAVTVTEHRLHRLRCPDCAAETRAELPADVPRGAFGPRLQAAVATLAVRNRVSRRDTVELMGELFGAELCDRLGRRDRAARRRGARRALRADCSTTSAAAAGGQHRRDRLAPARRQAHALGRAHPERRRSSGSPPTATSARPGRCSARTSRASPAPIAGGPTTTSTPSGASSAGRTSSATSPPTAKGSPPRRSSARPASRSPSACSRPGMTSADDGDRARLHRADRPAQAAS